MLKLNIDSNSENLKDIGGTTVSTLDGKVVGTARGKFSTSSSVKPYVVIPSGKKYTVYYGGFLNNTFVECCHRDEVHCKTCFLRGKNICRHNSEIVNVGFFIIDR